MAKVELSVDSIGGCMDFDNVSIDSQDGINAGKIMDVIGSDDYVLVNYQGVIGYFDCVSAVFNTLDNGYVETLKD